MALQKQTIPVILGKGLDTKTDSKVVQADKMLALENAVFTKRQSLATRYGSDLLSKSILGTSDFISNPRKVMTFKSELLLATRANIYSYISSSDSWSSRGSLSAASVTSTTVVRNTYSQSIPDGSSLKGISVFAWEEDGGVKASVFDDASGLPVLASVLISATGVKPKVFANAFYLYVYYIEGSNWLVRRISPASPTGFETALVVAADIDDNFDLHIHGNNLVYIYNAVGGACNIGYIKTNGQIGSPIDGFPTAVDSAGAGSSSVAIVSRFQGDFDDRIYAYYANTTDGLTCDVYDLNLTLVASVVVDGTTTEIRNITSVLTDSTTARVYYELDAAISYNALIKFNDVFVDGTVGTAAIGIRSLGLIGKAFQGSDGNFYVVCAYESPLQSTSFVMKDTFSIENLQVASVVAKGESGGLTNKNSSLSNVSKFIFTNLIKTQLESVSGEVYSLEGVQKTLIGFDDFKLFQSKELGGNLHIAGGVLYDYDGKTAFEHGFYFFPESVSNSIATSGGAIGAGTRQYAFVYEWTDNQGQLHQSATSIPISVTNAATDVNTITVPTLRVTKRCPASDRSAIRIVGYRTLNAGQIFYRFTAIDSTFFNDTEVDSIQITDGASDASIKTNDVMYTTGGVLENYAPGSCQVVEEYRNRLAVGGLEDEDLVRYSKEHVVNESVDFAEELSFRNEGGLGGVSALQRLDEKLLIFKPSEIYYQLGSGPTDTGAQDDYLQPIFITTDVGTRYPQSVVSMPLGVMFKSDKGYYLLSRSLEPLYVGEPVEAYNNLFVTGACLLDQYNEVRFTHSDGVTLVYDYVEGQWSTFTNKESISSVVWNGQWVILKADASVFVDNPNSYFDGQSPVTKKMTTAWLQAAQFQGAQRIYRMLFLGNLKSQHKLRIQVAYDFDPSIRETFIFDTEEILGSSYYGDPGEYGIPLPPSKNYYGGADPVYQIEIRPSIQKCQSIRFTIEDLNYLDINGAGFELTGMSALVGIKQGLFRPSMTKRVGPS